MKLSIIALLIILLALQYRLWLGDGGVTEVRRLEATIAEQRKLAATKTAEATKLADELAKEEARINELKSTYEKLKTAAKGEPTKTASAK